MTTATHSRPKTIRHWSFGEDVCDWIEANCVFPSGDQIGQPFRLLKWQREWIDELYRTDARGNLRYRWALLGVPKGNGKSPLAAALGLYNLLGDEDEPNPWVVCAAASDKQADIIFGAAKTMCELSPTLREMTNRYRWEIQRKDGRGKMERVAASGGKLDGKIVSMLLIDELHEWNRENWTVLTGGALKRKRGQIIQTTTAGFDLDTICGEEYLKGRRIEAGEVRNPTYFFRWFSASDGCDHRDPEMWKAANPSYGTLVHPSVLKDLVINQHESSFRRYRLNQWVASETLWLPPGAWENCRVADVALAPKTPTWVGWDASTAIDTTAVVAVQWQGTDAARRLVAVPRPWQRPMLSDGRPDESWRLPIADVEAYIRELAEKYNVRYFAYDPAFITWSAEDLKAQGLPMLNWPQSDSRMVPATQALYEVIVEGELAHAGDAVMTRHIANIVAYQVRQGGQRIGKGKQRASIDCAIALAMAVGAMRDDEGPSRGGVHWA